MHVLANMYTQIPLSLFNTKPTALYLAFLFKLNNMPSISPYWLIASLVFFFL